MKQAVLFLALLVSTESLATNAASTCTYRLNGRGGKMIHGYEENIQASPAKSTILSKVELMKLSTGEQVKLVLERYAGLVIATVTTDYESIGRNEPRNPTFETRASSPERLSEGAACAPGYPCHEHPTTQVRINMVTRDPELSQIDLFCYVTYYKQP